MIIDSLDISDITKIKKRSWNKGKCLSIRLSCFVVFGAEIVKVSERCIRSAVALVGSSFPFGREEEISFILIAESNPAVIIKDKLGSYKHRHIPLPLRGKKK